MQAQRVACSNFEPHKFRPAFCIHCQQKNDQHNGNNKSPAPGQSARTSVPQRALPPAPQTSSTNPTLSSSGAQRSDSPVNREVRKTAPPSSRTGGGQLPSPNRVLTSNVNKLNHKPLPPVTAQRAAGARRVRALEAGFIGRQQMEPKTVANANLFYEEIVKTVLFKGLKLSQLNGEDICKQVRLISPNLNEPPKLVLSLLELKILSELGNTISDFVREQHDMRKLIKLQSFVRLWLVRKKFKNVNLEQTRILRGQNQKFLELLKTEYTFCESLDALIANFVVPIRQQNILAPNESAFIFSNIEEITAEHKKLLKKLEDIKPKFPNSGNVGAVFLEIKDLLKSLSVYVSNFKSAINEVQRLSLENPRFLALVESASDNYDIDLSTALAIPMGRINKYELLLRDLADQFPEGTQEREDCEKAYAVMAQSSIVIRTSLQESTEISKVLAVQRKLKHDGPLNLLKPGRSHLTEFRTKKFMVYLFNDIIVTAKVGKTRHRLKRQWEITKVELNDIDSKTIELKSEGETLRLVAFAPEEKASFLRSYNQLIEEINRVKVFGVALGETVIREERSIGIPIIVETLTTFIEAHLKTQPGIFRVAGSTTEIQSLKDAFDAGIKDIRLEDKSCFSVCDCLKLYFRSLPEPMFGFDLYRPIVQLMRDETIAPEQRVAKIKEVVFQWTPSFALKVIRYLMQFLEKVSQCSEENKMTASNLSIVFGPTLLWSQTNTMESAMDMPYINSAVQIMIENYKQIF